MDTTTALIKFLNARLVEAEENLIAARDAMDPTFPPEVFESWDWVRRARAEINSKNTLVGISEMVGGVYGDALLLGLALAFNDHPDYRDEWKP